jgi:hypothetical protein
MECLNKAWSLEHRCWLAIVAPALIAFVALVVYVADRYQLRRDGNGNSREEPLLQSEEDDVGPPVNSAATEWRSFVARCYGVCVSLLYLLVFPCAQTALSAVTCTDLRELSPSSSDGESRIYLNLYPWQQCDSEWRHSILLPALLGVIFWFALFPLASTVLLRHLRARLDASAPPPAASSRSDSSSSSTAAAAAAAAASLWPLCSDLLEPYSPRYWYWEQVLLARRLALVAAVTIIPSSSLYLPLALFSLVQLAALLQHWSHPFSHATLNVGELASLYLLLLTYISALILQTGVSGGGFQQTANGWALLLFALNFLFVVALLAGLFGFVRVRGAVLLERARLWMEAKGWIGARAREVDDSK